MKDLFPYSSVRPIQEDFMAIVKDCLENSKDAILHAPTGLGKTAASLVPALEYALENNKIIFFLTSRHTQHRIAINTLKEIKQKHDIPLVVADIIGKQGMCAQKGVHTMRSSEFTEYCKAVKEERSCIYYRNLRNKNVMSDPAKSLVEDIKNLGPYHAQEILSKGMDLELCPYEVMLNAAKEANVVVADYYYVFNRSILDLFLEKIDRNLADCIIIVDEGHNLGPRIRELHTSRLSTLMLRRAAKEARKNGMEDTAMLVEQIGDILTSMADGKENEKLIRRQLFVDKVSMLRSYDTAISEIYSSAEIVLLENKRSSLLSVANFLESWRGENQGFARILSKEPKNLILSYRCLDPSIHGAEIIDGAHSTILMSGTLTPTSMYRELLGFPAGTEEMEFDSPFPEKNRLTMVIPRTTTKYSKRSPEQYRMIASLLAGISNSIPGNTAFFFPSYQLRDDIIAYFSPLSEKTLFTEIPGMTKDDKEDMIERFKSYSKSGAVLSAVASGSFGEGIDLPGDLLKAVVVIGLPLQVPDLETKELINYYDSKFSKGWDYGYVLPAITKVLQNAGRCIRSETDKGVIIFLEERYAWPQYKRCFPKDWDTVITMDFQNRIRDFFSS